MHSVFTKTSAFRFVASVLTACVLWSSHMRSAQAGLIVNVGPVNVNSTSQGGYYTDVTIRNEGSSLDVAGFSFGVFSTDAELAFTRSVGGVPSGTPGLVGISDYIFGDHGLIAGPANSFENTSSITALVPAGSALIASDFFDPTSALSNSLATGQSVGLGRVFFDYSGSQTDALAATIRLITNPNVTNLVDANASQITGEIVSRGDGNYGVDTPRGPSVPEPATMMHVALGALILVSGRCVRLRRKSCNR